MLYGLTAVQAPAEGREKGSDKLSTPVCRKFESDLAEEQPSVPEECVFMVPCIPTAHCGDCVQPT